MSPPRLVILISGRGSNLQAIAGAVSDRRLQAEIAAVISNRADAAGLTWARRHGLATAVIDQRVHTDRALFDRSLQDTIDRFCPDWVILAGFLRILNATAVEHYQGRLLNIHPSLLPDYPGLDTHARILAAGEHWHGASVHFVSSEVDAGPVVAQVRIPVNPNDDAQHLAARVLRQEHRLYPWAIELCASGCVTLNGNRVLLRGQPLATPLQLLTGAT